MRSWEWKGEGTIIETNLSLCREISAGVYQHFEKNVSNILFFAMLYNNYLFKPSQEIWVQNKCDLWWFSDNYCELDWVMVREERVVDIVIVFCKSWKKLTKLASLFMQIFFSWCLLTCTINWNMGKKNCNLLISKQNTINS